jgi:hypothetical protein
VRKTFLLTRTSSQIGHKALGWADRDGCRDKTEEVRRLTEYLEGALPVGKRIVGTTDSSVTVDGYPEE